MSVKNSKSKSKKQDKKSKIAQTISKPRKIKPAPKISSSFKLMWLSIKLLNQHWKLFSAITFIYGILTVILVHGLANNLDLNNLKSALERSQGNNSNPVANATTLFSYVVAAASSTSSQAGSVYQLVLIVLMSLVIIWALRQVLAGKIIHAKEAFYSGTYPLFPFILVLLVIGIQLIPFAIGSRLLNVVINNTIAISALEKFSWGLLFAVLMFWSLYMISSSIFALYIVTLPDMTPIKALRSAKQIVKHRRFKLIRKILFLPFAMIMIGLVISIPLILLLTSLATWLFFILSLSILLLVHTYMYMLYRELL